MSTTRDDRVWSRALGFPDVHALASLDGFGDAWVWVSYRAPGANFDGAMVYFTLPVELRLRPSDLLAVTDPRTSVELTPEYMGPGHEV